MSTGQFCYLDDGNLQPDGETGTCLCYTFYGFTNYPECDNKDGVTRGILSAFTLGLCLFAWFNWWQTLSQLKTVKAFKARTASGHVLIMCFISNTFEIFMNVSYLITSLALDPSYAVHDYMRSLAYGMCVVFKLAGVFEVPIMWMDIVIKSPGMNSDENKGRFKKAANTLRGLAIFCGLFVLACMGSGNSQIAGAFFVFVLVGLILLFRFSSRRLASMICANFFELGYNPDEKAFANSAEKSGHNAAKNIMVVDGRFIKVTTPFVISLVLYSGSVKRSDTGIVPYVCVHIFLFCCAGCQIIFKDYVRLGARKKLIAGGFGPAGASAKVSDADTVKSTASEGL